MKAIFFLIVLFFNSYALSEEHNNSYIEIISNNLIITETPLVSEFIGNVYAKNGINHLWGDKMIVNYDNNKKIRLITVKDNVIFKRLNQKITGNNAMYYPKIEKIVVTGSVIVIKDNNILTGDELTVDLLSSASIIKGNNNKQVSVKVAK